MSRYSRLRRIDALLIQWGEWRVTGKGPSLGQSILGKLVMRQQCPVCRGKGRVRAIMRKGGIGETDCSSCGGRGHTTVSDRRVHPHLIPGTNPNPMPDHLIDVDRAILELPDQENRVICEHYCYTPWWTVRQHARKVGMAKRTYERLLQSARLRLADRLWPS